MTETLCIIDGHAQIYRGYYALAARNFTAADGRPTGAAYGFLKLLGEMLGTVDPGYVVAVFDPPGGSFRKEIYPEYKVQRQPPPPDLLAQIPLVEELVRAMRIPVLEVPGFEADDVIGTLARQARERGLEVVIATGDKDCGQLLADGVRLYVPGKKGEKHRFVDAAAFEADWGVKPDRVPDLFGLIGDASDNIPGVAGIGPKTGAPLIRQYGSLEKLLERAHEIKGKRGEVLRASKDAARLSKELATIRTDAPVEFDPEASRRQAPDYARLREEYVKLGFQSLLRALDAAAAGTAPETDPAAPAACDYRLVNTPESFAEFVALLEKREDFAFDTETRDAPDRPAAASPDPLRAELAGMSFSWEDGAGHYLPWLAPEGTPVLGAAEMARLRPILENPAIRKYAQNGKFDLLALRGCGIELRGLAFDTLIAGGLARAGQGELNLEALAARHLGVAAVGYAQLVGTGRARVTIDQVEIGRVAHYAGEDADLVWRLKPVLERELADKGLAELYGSVELPLAGLLADMQGAGVRVDVPLLREMSEASGRELANLEAEIHRLAGRDFNVASPAQLGEVLFADMGLSPTRKTATGKPSTDEDTLAELAAQGHEIAERLLEHRALAKLKGTYLDALPELVNPRTGRVHTSFSQTLTATGRLSSRDPNLQNIPVRTARGRAVRQAFVPAEGWRMLAADYSQVELRVLAHFTGDAALLAAFAEGRDIHRAVAARLAGVAEDKVAPDMRAAAKAVNFGIVYGQSAFGLSRSTGMARGRAQRFIDDYFASFPRVRGWLDAAVEEARSAGFVRTILGRRRDLPDLASPNRPLRARAEREAVNTIVQGSAADLVKVAMLGVAGRMARETPQARLLLQIHDELLLEAPPGEMPALERLVREEMESALAGRLRVPLAVEAGVGANWLEAK